MTQKFAKVRVTYDIEVAVTDEEAAAIDGWLDANTEDKVVGRALDQIRANPGRDRDEEILDVRE